MYQILYLANDFTWVFYKLPLWNGWNMVNELCRVLLLSSTFKTSFGFLAELLRSIASKKRASESETLSSWYVKTGLF